MNGDDPDWHGDEDDAPVAAHSGRERYRLALALARAAIATGETGGLHRRLHRALGRSWPWLGALTRELRSTFGDPPAAVDFPQIAAWIDRFPPLAAACATSATEKPLVRGYFTRHPIMTAGHPALPGLPLLATPGELADWLAMDADELAWFADPGGWRGRGDREATHHYRYRWQNKARGGQRLIEAPKPRLKAIQRQILDRILARIPPHPAAHGGIPGRSALSNAAGHTGRAMVLRLDLEEFFPRIGSGRARAVFTEIGYPRTCAQTLADLCSHRTPPAVLRTAANARGPAGLDPLSGRHLPQGAPTSAALANLCAYRLDLRLAGAALACGGHYSRYVDDLIFSWPECSPARTRRALDMFYAIIVDEGYRPNYRKTRQMPRSARQMVTGITVNHGPNLPRREFDRLKATLTNCLRLGPASQNRLELADFHAHLRGRVARFEHIHPERGARLRGLFDAIRWP